MLANKDLSNVFLTGSASNGDAYLGKALMVDAVTGEIIPTSFMFVDGGNLPNSPLKAGQFIRHPENGNDGMESVDLGPIFQAIRDTAAAEKVRVDKELKALKDAEAAETARVNIELAKMLLKDLTNFKNSATSQGKFFMAHKDGTDGAG